MKGTEFPEIVSVEPWDGKDGVLPDADELDLSDVELEDLDTGKNEL